MTQAVNYNRTAHMPPGRAPTVTPEITLALCEAIGTHPSKKLACQACGVGYDTVKGWLRKARVAGANQAYVDFAVAFGRAEAAHARMEFQEFRDATRDKNSREAASILKYLHMRFPSISTDTEVMDIMETSEACAETRKSLLASPPPRMLQEMKIHGWWQFPVHLAQEDRDLLHAVKAKYARESAKEAEPKCLPASTTQES